MSFRLIPILEPKRTLFIIVVDKVIKTTYRRLDKRVINTKQFKPQRAEDKLLVKKAKINQLHSAIYYSYMHS